MIRNILKKVIIICNAIKIMINAGAPFFGSSVISDAVQMIRLVSCSSGNNCPPEFIDSPEILWPRWASRLEEIGEIGILKCYLYNLKKNYPIALESSPCPLTEDDVLNHITDDRFKKYLQSGGNSKSMIDHYYDKLLYISRPDPLLVQNSYLEEKILHRTKPLLDICLAYSKKGVDGVLEKINEISSLYE